MLDNTAEIAEFYQSEITPGRNVLRIDNLSYRSLGATHSPVLGRNVFLDIGHKEVDGRLIILPVEHEGYFGILNIDSFERGNLDDPNFHLLEGVKQFPRRFRLRTINNYSPGNGVTFYTGNLQKGIDSWSLHCNLPAIQGEDQ